MKGLIKNEISLYLTRRNMVLFLLYVLVLISIFHFIYIPEYDTYYTSKYDEVIELQEPIEVAIINLSGELFTNNIRVDKLREEIETALEFKKKRLQKQLDQLNQANKELSEDLGHLKVLFSASEFLKTGYEKPETNFALIGENWEKIDDYLDHLYYNDIKVSASGIFMADGRDWTARKLLREADQDMGLGYKVNEEYPSGLTSIYKFLRGENWYFALSLILFLVFANFDVWSMDFEENEGKIIYTLPFSKGKIFRTRLFVRILMNLALVFLGLVLIFIYAGIRYDFGPNLHVIVNSNTLENILSFETNLGSIWKTDIAIRLTSFIGYGLIIVASYVIFIYSIINFVSLILKNSSISIMSGLSLMGITVVGEELVTKNPLAFYRVKDILMNGTTIAPSVIAPTNMGFAYYVLVLLGVSAILNILADISFRIA